MTTSQMIADFTTLAIQAGGWMELDRLYLQNRLLSMIGEQELGEVDIRPRQHPPLIWRNNCVKLRVPTNL